MKHLKQTIFEWHLTSDKNVDSKGLEIITMDDFIKKWNLKEPHRHNECMLVIDISDELKDLMNKKIFNDDKDNLYENTKKFYAMINPAPYLKYNAYIMYGQNKTEFNITYNNDKILANISVSAEMEYIATYTEKLLSDKDGGTGVTIDRLLTILDKYLTDGK